MHAPRQARTRTGTVVAGQALQEVLQKNVLMLLVAAIEPARRRMRTLHDGPYFKVRLKDYEGELSSILL